MLLHRSPHACRRAAWWGRRCRLIVQQLAEHSCKISSDTCSWCRSPMEPGPQLIMHSVPSDGRRSARTTSRVPAYGVYAYACPGRRPPWYTVQSGWCSAQIPEPSQIVGNMAQSNRLTCRCPCTNEEVLRRETADHLALDLQDLQCHRCSPLMHKPQACVGAVHRGMGKRPQFITDTSCG